jgi:hypothetical protein
MESMLKSSPLFSFEIDIADLSAAAAEAEAVPPELADAGGLEPEEAAQAVLVKIKPEPIIKKNIKLQINKACGGFKIYFKFMLISNRI